MKKTFLALLLSAVGVWSYVVMQFFSGYFGKMKWDSRSNTTSLSKPLHAMRNLPTLDTAFRNPFQTYLYTQKPTPPKALELAKTVRSSLVIIEPPNVVLGGVLWGDSPVAILKANGQTELVKEGIEVFGVRVAKIERHQVAVVKQGRKFVLGY